jgi:hypothetical protein
VPTRLWVEGGTIGELTVDRCILGPIRTRGSGKIETLQITDSILQAIPMGLSDTVTSPPQDSAVVASPPEPSLTNLVLELEDGEVRLSRCTVMGQLRVHRLQVSECILHDLARVDDIQNGCVRFTAWAQGSQLPRQYESVQIPPEAALFVSTDFGQPGFGQLLATADANIIVTATVAGASQTTILAGAQDGAEMGAFAREKNPVKERSLLIKYEEFMPAGLIPVPVYVT